MNCWEILELEPTSDKKRIKMAYEEKLKMIDEDAEPLAFHTLKEAFDSALFLSGTIIESNRPVVRVEGEQVKEEQAKADRTEVAKETPEQDIEEVEPQQFNENETSESIYEKKPTNHVALFDQELTEIFEQKDFFATIEKWTPLFSNQLAWSSDEHNQIKDRMQEFLLANYRVLSREVITYIGSFFDFDSLVKEYKSGDYFCYSWSEIKQVPLFAFDIYRDISKEQRIQYFTNRYELFQIVDNGVVNQSSWQERLDWCGSVTTKDYDVVTLEISYLLLNDFRMEQERTVTTFKKLLNEAKALKEGQELDFFRTYYEWVKNDEATNDVLTFDKSELTLSITIIDLLMGYVYFKLRRYSCVKECWAELAQKNPSLFRENELALLQPAEPVQILPKKQKGVGSYLGAIFLLIVAVVKIGGVISRNNEDKAYTTPSEIQNLFSGERNVNNNFVTSSASALKESENLYDQFVYYFYVDREDPDRADFVETNLTGHAKEMAQKLTISDLPELAIDSKYAFHSSPDIVAEYGPVTALTLLEKKEPFIILQEDHDEKISTIFGTGWEILPKDKFDALWADIQVRPMMSQKFFVIYYLLSDERKENLKDNPEYTTENVKKMLEKNSSMPTAVEFESGTWQISQDEEDKLYTIINDENNEHRFILSYDDYGRLEHIYGDKWEKMEEVKQKLIYDNAEETIGVY